MGTMKFRVSMVFGALLAVGASGCGDSNTEPPDAGGMCAPGQAGCACIDGTMCQGGLMCEMGLCRAVDAIEIEVTDVNARACEVVVIEEGAEVLGVDFADGTRGTNVHESPRTAVTFTRETDTAFAPGAVTVRRTDSAGAMLSLQRGRCFDREGNELAGSPLRLVE